jgi:hypothetical protein
MRIPGVVVLFTCVFLSAVEARGQLLNPVMIEGIYPLQAVRGQTTVVSVALPRGAAVQRVDITPSAGVRVARIDGNADSNEQAIGWWDIALDAAADASSGDRTMVITTSMGSTPPTPLLIASHAPAITNLAIVPASGAQPAELRLTAADAQGDLGVSPYVWFTAACGGDLIAGALRSAAAAGVVRAVLPELRGSCQLRAHVTDDSGSESNTLSGSATFATVRAQTTAAVRSAPAQQDWSEFASREDRFTINFPGEPVKTDAVWTSQYGAVLPARIYSGAEGSARYSITVVDYNPLHRILSERSRTLPALDLAVHDYGIGYWKTDIRGASVFAASKFLERDGKVTSLLSNFADGVVGIQVQFVSNADQSRTFCSIYMHANRLVIAEAVVPRGYPAPLIFQQSLGWLDEKGARIRYQSPMNYNEPDAPRTTSQAR